MFPQDPISQEDQCDQPQQEVEPKETVCREDKQNNLIDDSLWK
uniref:Uncharacterized protein n=1 Tax=Rhizophora mucronata TaxID=61149 RepID=A0A2P2IY41_RHIMU